VRWRFAYLGLLVAFLAVEITGVIREGKDDTATELLISPAVNWDVLGFPLGWLLLMGFVVWFAVHSHRKRRRGI